MSAATATAAPIAPRATPARVAAPALSPVQAAELALWGSVRAPRVVNDLCRYCGLLVLAGGAHDGCDRRTVLAIGEAYTRAEHRYDWTTDTHYMQRVGTIVAVTEYAHHTYGNESDRPFFNRPGRPRFGARVIEPAHSGPVLSD